MKAAVLTGLIAWFRLRDIDAGFLRIHDAVVFAVLTVVYPLMVVDTDRTGVWMQMFYLAVLVFFCILLVRYRARLTMSKRTVVTSP